MPHAAGEARKECANGHKNVRDAADKVRKSGEQLEQHQREVRHGTRNIRMLLTGVLERLERRNDERD